MDGLDPSRTLSTTPQTSPQTRPTPTTAPTTTPPPATTPTTTIPTTTIPPNTDPAGADPYATPGWLAAENLLPGTNDWRPGPDIAYGINSRPAGWIEGFADATSVQPGSTLTLFVDTPAASFTVWAYRMGWYGGTQGRLVWLSQPTTGGRQFLAEFDQTTGTATAPWQPSLSIDITDQWPPGQYLLKLVSDMGGTHYVPVTVRDDRAAGGLLVVSAVTTWQAYNPWGGCSMYRCAADREHDRAQVVSFNRPYSNRYHQGTADFLDHELPLVSLVEFLGIDAAYVTDVDLHTQPSIVGTRHGIITLGHDEYYSTPMRAALELAVASGINIAFLGANAVYRHIRLEPDAAGKPNRRMANFRDHDDPGAFFDPLQSTVEWRDAPLSRPEAPLIGIQYGCAGARAAMQLVNTDSWLVAGIDATSSHLIANLVGVEFDTLASRSLTPPTLEVIAASPVVCRGLPYQHVMSYYSNTAGAGVFATGTINWICAIDGSCSDLEASAVVWGITANMLREFAAGPAGVKHPSRPNANNYRTPPTLPPSDTVPPPDTLPTDTVPLDASNPG